MSMEHQPQPDLIPPREGVEELVREDRKLVAENKEIIPAEATISKIENEFGDVEVTRLRKQGEPAKKAVFYLPGITGSVNKFTDRFAAGLLEAGYELVLVHRNGSNFERAGDKNVNSNARQELAKEQGQVHLGSKDAYGYKEWTHEFACAAHSLAADYDEITVMGASFGGLAAMESLRLLGEAEDTALEKIKTFVGLSGHIGAPVDGWLDPKRNFSVFPGAEPIKHRLHPEYEGEPKSPEGYYGPQKHKDQGVREGNLLDFLGDNPAKSLDLLPGNEICKEYLEIGNRLYAEGSKLPKEGINMIQVYPWQDPNFSTEQSRAALKYFGKNGLFVVDRAQPIEDPHSLPELKTAMLLYYIGLDPEKFQSRVIIRRPDDTINENPHY